MYRAIFALYKDSTVSILVRCMSGKLVLTFLPLELLKM